MGHKALYWEQGQWNQTLSGYNEWRQDSPRDLLNVCQEHKRSETSDYEMDLEFFFPQLLFPFFLLEHFKIEDKGLVGSFIISLPLYGKNVKVGTWKKSQEYVSVWLKTEIDEQPCSLTYIISYFMEIDLFNIYLQLQNTFK